MSDEQNMVSDKDDTVRDYKAPPGQQEPKKNRKRFNRVFFKGLFIIAGVVAVLWGASPFVKIGFNITDSVDGTAFIILKNVPPKRGGLFAFHPPENDLYDRHYFVKFAWGFPGDTVRTDGRQFFINGQYIGSAKEESGSGVKLEPSHPGTIPSGYYFSYTSHERSFDSRYAQIGLIPESAVIGRAYRLF